MNLAIRYLAVLVMLAAGDFAWLNWFGPNMFRPMAGTILLENPRWSAVILFYLLYAGGVVLFPLGLARGWASAALYGALFGFMAYMTYEATNFATIKVWAAPVVFADIAWGCFLTALAATAGYAVLSFPAKG